MIASLLFVLIFSTAFVTPFPKYLSLSPSLNSSASNSPVDAPLGAVPLATVPSTNVISASTAVSYTHLDVYKRQTLYRIVDIIAGNLQRYLEGEQLTNIVDTTTGCKL